MKRSDAVILAVSAAGLFMAGVVWRPVFGDYTKIKEALEGTSFLATTIAAVVAIYTLSAWKAQFRHAERFKSLKDLKDAATDLHVLRGFLLCVERRCAHLMHTNGVPSEELELAEETAKQKWLNALQAYNRAWSTAVVFFTPEEEKAFSGPANIFTDKYMDNTMRIVMLYANAPGLENFGSFSGSCRVITDSVKDLYAATVSELEWMLRQKFGG
ncbi:hypothetical protein [Pseudomonas sp. BF-B-25]|uniref:hypothetical protein n=1 Tax=Pseudomonas sp. BF-B-25 TaxID=2832355 RepID=UPI001CBDCD21|nr:hypothetical protein [Pseudomonas sp. BF-B-25]